MISITTQGDLSKTVARLQKLKNIKFMSILDSYGQKGVTELANATPKRTGKTAASWTYRVVKNGDQYEIQWANTNTNRGVNIAIILQYGHGTRQGGYVRGIDYINPVLKDIFEGLKQDLIKEVSEL